MRKISGYTFIRNGFRYGLPFVESIKSILPICDELVVVVGDSDDGTREGVESIASPKLRIIDTVWDMSLRTGGKIFAQQSNIGLDAIDGDWAFYIQGDELFHENDLIKIKNAIEEYHNDKSIDGFLSPFLHFWGDYNNVQNSRNVHRYEIRVFRNSPLVRSYRDAQGFRIYDSIDGYNNGTDKGKKLSVKHIDAPVYHYNGVKSNASMLQKANCFEYFYGKDNENPAEELFDYHAVPSVKKFSGSHPAVMAKRISDYKYVFNHDKSKAKWRIKDRLIQPIENLLGCRFGEYKNYKLLK